MPSDPVINPLRLLCDQMGISPPLLAAKSGLSIKRCVTLLANPTTDQAIADYHRLAESIGVVMRVASAPGVRVSVRYSSVDRLVTNDAWRKANGLCPFCNHKAEVKQIAEVIHRRGLSYRDMSDYFQRNFILLPGYRDWTKNLVVNLFNDRKSRIAAPTGRKQVGSKAQWLRRWRFFVASRLMVAILPVDTRAKLRYGLMPSFGDEAFVIESAPAIPACVAVWIREQMQTLDWFRAAEWSVSDVSKSESLSPT